jgi:competence protein ComEC
VSSDLRLGLPAVAAWIVAWQARLVDPRLVGLLAAGLLVGAVVSLVRQQFLVAAVLVCAAGSGAVTAMHVHSRTTGPLAGLAARQAAVAVEAVLLDDPRVASPRGDQLTFRALVAARVRVERVTAAGESIRLRQQVLVLSSDTTLLGRLPSQRLRLEGRLQAPDRGDDVAALLSERGPPVLLGQPSLLQRAAGALRQGLRDRWRRCPRTSAACCPALSTGTPAVSTRG